MLIRHFPNFLQLNRQNLNICQSLDADADGVARFENVVNIVPTTQTLDERKTNILAKMNKQLPYTLNKLRSRLLEQCGQGNFSIELEHLNYLLRVNITIKQDYNKVYDIIDTMIPCNLIQNIIVMYESHRRIREMEATDGDYQL